MSGALSYELARRADELLGDGEWHNYEATMRALIRLVPPGRAMRQNEHDRIGSGYGMGPPARKQPRDTGDMITSGARTIVRQFLESVAFEATPPKMPRDPERQIRQLGRHRALTGDPYRQQRDRLEVQLETARDQIKALRAYLVEIGHGEAADRLAPET